MVRPSTPRLPPRVARPGAWWSAWLAAVALGACAWASAASGTPIVFMGDRDLAPYEFLQDGEPRGANVDLARAIGRELGRPVDVRLQDWAQAQSALLAGQGDALTMLGRTAEREKHHVFTQPTVPVSFALFVRADETARFAGSLKGQRIGVTRAGLPREYFESRHPEAVLVVVDNLADGTRRLLRRDIDGFAAQEWSQYYLLGELGIEGIVGLPAFSTRYGNIAFRRADVQLARDVDLALDRLKANGEFDRIIGRWSSTRVQLLRQSTVNAAVVAGAVALLALVLLTLALAVLRHQRSVLRATKQQLEAADRRKDEFLATLAHELRNPLAPISNATRVLQLRGDAAPEAQRAQGIIARQVRHLARLVDDLLDISRINTGKLELRRDIVDLNAAIGDAVEVSRPAIDGAGHALDLRLHAAPLWLDADRVRVAQIATNLLINAARYTTPGGRIELASEREGDRAVLRVRDNGIGIDPGRIGRIFEMFYQEDRSPGRVQGGLGIGLWLTRELVTLHGGSIAVASDGQGRGSEFTVELPLAAPHTIPAPPAGAGAADAHRRILVVDDNRDSAETMALLLAEFGHEAQAAHSGEEALRCGAAMRPDLVFLDIGMPGMDGYEVCRRLRATDWGLAAEVIALTGWGGEADKAAARAAGFDGHLTKPAAPEAVAALAARSKAGVHPG